MKEVYRTNDIVKLSYYKALLAEAEIECLVFDQHASIVEGSIGAIQQRLMVLEEDLNKAFTIIKSAEKQES